MCPVSAHRHVVLAAVRDLKGGCGPALLDFIRVLPDGRAESGPQGIGYRVRAGQALVITDVDWQYIHPKAVAAEGSIEVLRLFIENLDDPGESRRAFESTIILGSQGEGGISEAATSGFVVSSKARICPDVYPGPLGPPSGLQHVLLRGYLIDDI